MRQRGHLRTRRCDNSWIDRCQNNARFGPGFSDHLSPGIDDERVAKGLPTVLVPSALGSGEHERAVLDSTCPDEHMPMCLPGLLGEGGGNGKKRAPCLRHCPIEARKTKIIADTQSKPA